MKHNTNDIPYRVIFLDETLSTNSYLSELCNNEQVEELTTVLAEFQTAGRGQRGNTWESQPGCNLLFSFVLHPTFLMVKQQFIISQVVSLGIYEALSSYADGFSIKWPNDIYWHNKKVAGVLIENDLVGHMICHSIVGVGLNINQQNFVSNAPNPVSLYQITGKEIDRIEVLQHVLDRVKHYYQLLKKGDTHIINERYMNVLFRKSGFYLYRDNYKTFSAEIAGIEDSGRLLLKERSGEERGYFFKEVEALI